VAAQVSLFKRTAMLTAADLVAQRTSARSQPNVSNMSSLRHSAVWACRRLRADLASTMPIDVYRDIDGVKVEQKKPPIFITPGGDEVDW